MLSIIPAGFPSYPLISIGVRIEKTLLTYSDELFTNRKRENRGKEKGFRIILQDASQRRCLFFCLLFLYADSINPKSTELSLDP